MFALAVRHASTRGFSSNRRKVSHNELHALLGDESRADKLGQHIGNGVIQGGLLDSAGNLLPLNEQLAQLAKGYAYATELMPSVTESFKEMVKVIGDNKETIKDAVKGWGSTLKTVEELLVFIGEQLHVVSERA